MSTLNDKLACSKENINLIERNYKMQENRKKEKKRKIDTYRNITIGRIFSKYFPDVSHFQPRYALDDNNIEFADLELFISELAENEENMSRFKTIIQQKMIMNKCESSE